MRGVRSLDKNNGDRISLVGEEVGEGEMETSATPSEDIGGTFRPHCECLEWTVRIALTFPRAAGDAAVSSFRSPVPMPSANPSRLEAILHYTGRPAGQHRESKCARESECKL